jgi:hypothetical protein
MRPVMSFQTAFKYLALLFAVQIAISFIFYASPGTCQVKRNVISSSVKARPVYDDQQLEKLFSFFNARHNETLSLIKSLKLDQLNQTISTTKKNAHFDKYLHLMQCRNSDLKKWTPASSTVVSDYSQLAPEAYHDYKISRGCFFYLQLNSYFI